MTTSKRKMLTIVIESAIENQIAEELERSGLGGFTTVEARGLGERGRREGDWDQSRSVRIETICEEATAIELANRVLARWGEDYALVLWLHDVEVLRPGKFGPAAGR